MDFPGLEWLRSTPSCEVVHGDMRYGTTKYKGATVMLHEFAIWNIPSDRRAENGLYSDDGRRPAWSNVGLASIMKL